MSQRDLTPEAAPCLVQSVVAALGVENIAKDAIDWVSPKISDLAASRAQHLTTERCKKRTIYCLVGGGAFWAA